jgi:hypothetical protein
MLDSTQRRRPLMNFQLIVPDLFWPAAAGSAPYRDLALPSLEMILARGQRIRTTGSSLERWLAAAFALPAELPLAPYALRGEGRGPGDDFWIHADPVHLKVHGDRLVLADATRLDITSEEAREFISALNAQFAADGIALEAPNPERWYVKSAEEPHFVSTPTGEMAARSIEPFLPSGESAARWRKIANEAQMVLHAHPRNEAREARGALPVNSLWFWGAGRARQLASVYDYVWSDHPLASGLAAASSAIARPLPASAAAILAEPGVNMALVVVNSLPPTAYGDVLAWRDAVIKLERAWLAPLLAALQDGKLHSLALHGLGPDYGCSVTLTPNDRFRFWRRKRPLHHYVIKG